MRRVDYNNAKKLCIAAAKNNKNVLLIGTHGIGKTYLVTEVAEKLGLKMGYWSASTMDPYIDLVGVPHVNDEGKLSFAMREDIFDMEFLFFDELNRAPIKVRNSVLELVQFQRINGRELPKLKMVWAAINPPTDDYQVEELDPALKDRFHIHTEMKPSPDYDYLATQMEDKTAEKILAWWNGLNDEDQEKITPRRLEYIGSCFDLGFNPKDIVHEPISKPAVELLVSSLKRKTSAGSGVDKMDMLNPKIVKNKFDQVIESVWMTND